MIDRLNELNKQLDFLKSALTDLPTDVLTFTQLVEENADYIPQSEIEDILLTYKPKVTEKNLISWRKIASDIKSEKEICRGLQRYKNIDRQLIDIEKIINVAAIQVDEWIELQVDAEIEERAFHKQKTDN